jgi:hypothetical protein
MLLDLNKNIGGGGFCDRELIHVRGNTTVIPPLWLTVFFTLMVMIAVALVLT